MQRQAQINSIFLLMTMLLFGQLWSQDDFYADDHIPEIKIFFTQDNWDELLDALFIEGDEQRLLAAVEIDGTLLPDVGVRYKGFSSASVDYAKNPFNIKLDYVDGSQNYQGRDKIKLSNVIQDPSFLREVLSYEVGRKYMPAGMANFAKLFINDVYWGLYTNVEPVDKEFLNEHFVTIDNSFFKCNPSSLNLFGENSNLSDSPGTDEVDYYDLYQLKSDQGWSELVNFIDVLNNDIENVEPVLNIDRALWMNAFNYALINFDSYVGYAQNYYLYQDLNGQFNPLIWDLNMSFGSFRLTDGSEFFDGFSIAEAITMDPLYHYSSFSVFPRPMMSNLFENDTYRRMYLAHMRTIIEENFGNGEYATRAQYYHDFIAEHVLADTNKFYTDEDFVTNLNSTVTDLVQYPGITELMDGRTEFLLTYPGFENAPTIDDIGSIPATLMFGGDLAINANIEGANNVILAYRFGGTDIFTNHTMLDDGQGDDAASGDGIYTASLTNVGNAIDYYIYAENDESGRFSPERAAYEFYSMQATIDPSDLVINEFMAFNSAGASDGTGDYDDWIELYNNTSSTISTEGLYLSDDPLNPVKWAMPNVTIAADGYQIVWADEQGSEGSLHANFQLSTFGEFISIAYGDSTIIDSVTFEEVGENQSIARFTNGTVPFV
jgi:spore coat protein CotH